MSGKFPSAPSEVGENGYSQLVTSIKKPSRAHLHTKQTLFLPASFLCHKAVKERSTSIDLQFSVFDANITIWSKTLQVGPKTDIYALSVGEKRLFWEMIYVCFSKKRRGEETKSIKELGCIIFIKLAKSSSINVNVLKYIYIIYIIKSSLSHTFM